MLKGATVPRLSHILKSVKKNNHSAGWMAEMDGAHLSAWLHCLTASGDLENDLGTEKKVGLSDLLDLSASYGGAGLESLALAADKEFMGSFVGIAAALISFYKVTELSAYIRIAEALEGTEGEGVVESECAIVKGVKEAFEMMEWLREPLSDEESKTTTEPMNGSRVMETPGAYDPERPDSVPEPVTLPEPRTLGDYVTAPCKHECSIPKQSRHDKQAHRLLTTLNPTKQSLLRAAAGECGLDSPHCNSFTIQEVVSMDRPGGGNGGSREASLFCAATLHRFGLPMDYARLKHETLPESFACCNAPLWNLAIPGTTMDTLFAWQCHMGRCEGDGRRLHAHEVVKRALRDLLLSNPSPGGTAFPSSSVLIEPLHLNKNKSRPRDIMALGRDVHMLDTAMDLVIASDLQKSCLSSIDKSSDIVLKAAEKSNFRKDLNSANPISSSCTMRFVPLALNHVGLRGPPFPCSSQGVCYDYGY